MWMYNERANDAERERQRDWNTESKRQKGKGGESTKQKVKARGIEIRVKQMLKCLCVSRWAYHAVKHRGTPHWSIQHQAWYTPFLKIWIAKWSWHRRSWGYGVATVSRIDKIIGLFCRISSLLSGSFAKETYNFIDPNIKSHPISLFRPCKSATAVGNRFSSSAVRFFKKGVYSVVHNVNAHEQAK